MRTSAAGTSDGILRVDLGDERRTFERLDDAVAWCRELGASASKARVAYRDARCRLGAALLQLRSQTKRGEWGAFVERLGLNLRTVQSCMQVAARFCDEHGRLVRDGAGLVGKAHAHAPFSGTTGCAELAGKAHHGAPFSGTTGCAELAGKAHHGAPFSGTTGCVDGEPTWRQLRMAAARPAATCDGIEDVEDELLSDEEFASLATDDEDDDGAGEGGEDEGEDHDARYAAHEREAAAMADGADDDRERSEASLAMGDTAAALREMRAGAGRGERRAAQTQMRLDGLYELARSTREVEERVLARASRDGNDTGERLRAAMARYRRELESIEREEA